MDHARAVPLRSVSARLSQNIVRQLGFQVALDAAGADAGEKWQLVCRLNETRTRGDFGTITFSRSFLQSMVDNWEREGKPEKPWNYFHRGAKADPSLRNEDKVAAGWVKGLKVDDEGLKLLTEWTPKAKAAIDAKELRYPSMEFHENGVDSKTGKPQGPTFYGCALTNNPFLDNLPPVEAEADPKGTTTMFTLAQLVSIFSLSKDTTEANVEERLKAKAAEMSTQAGALEKLTKDLAEATKARELQSSDAMRKLEASNVELAGKVVALEKRAKDAEVDNLIVELERGDGKHSHIVASQKPQVREFAEKQGVEAARKFFTQFKAVAISERGANVPEGGLTPELATKQLQEKAKELSKDGVLTPADALIRAMEMNPDLARAARPATQS